MEIVEADSGFTLARLNKFVAQSEKRLLGPLTAIGNRNNKTTLTINDQAAGNPTPPSQIATEALPPGATKIGDGQVYISGKLTNATAYSPAKS
jgi:hypothetical protein